MDRKQVMALALECGVCDKDLSNEAQVLTDYGDATDAVVLFAQKVAEAEREACAKVCEDLSAYQEYDPGESFAAAIRMRSNKSKHQGPTLSGASG